ncbi:MAG: integrator complex subunit 3 [Terracidiphilus sp.]|nr:integrator complex subunit 3 [Terracidiphilus sp.]
MCVCCVCVCVCVRVCVCVCERVCVCVCVPPSPSYTVLGDIWSSILSSPPPSPLSLPSLLTAKSHKPCLLSRVPVELETQLLFVLRNVKMGSQRRYQTWMAQR